MMKSVGEDFSSSDEDIDIPIQETVHQDLEPVDLKKRLKEHLKVKVNEKLGISTKKKLGKKQETIHSMRKFQNDIYIEKLDEKVKQMQTKGDEALTPE